MPEVLDAPQKQRNATPPVVSFYDRTVGRIAPYPFEAYCAEDRRTTPQQRPFFSTVGSLLDLVNFDDIIHQIGVLASGDVKDEFGILRPTEHAMRTTFDILESTVKAMLQNAARHRIQLVFPRGAVTTDDEGGIRIEWSNIESAVHLIVSAELGGKLYIYHESSGDYGTEKQVSGGRLANWLRLFD